MAESVACGPMKSDARARVPRSRPVLSCETGERRRVGGVAALERDRRMNGAGAAAGKHTDGVALLGEEAGGGAS